MSPPAPLKSRSYRSTICRTLRIAAGSPVSAAALRASSAIAASTLSALLVCVVIASLFVQVLLQVELKWVVGALFTGSTLALVVGLGYFLREVHLATKTVRIPGASAAD